jgi:formamidopyrimidine-DNA glycosylase
MPELPEVETIRLSLEKNLVGKVINSVTVLEPKQFVGDKNLIIGQSITSIERKGKVISIKLSNYYYISIHLKLSGQLLYGDNKDQSEWYCRIYRKKCYTRDVPKGVYQSIRSTLCT